MSIFLFLASSFATGGPTAAVRAAEPARIVNANNAGVMYNSTMPLWNIYIPKNLVTEYSVAGDVPLMLFDYCTNTSLLTDIDVG